MPKNSKTNQKLVKTSFDPVVFFYLHRVGVFMTTGVLLFLLSINVWWKFVYQNPHQVFRAMLANGLSTTGVTRQVNTNQNGSEIEQYIQLSFVGWPTARSFIKLSQGSEKDSKTTVKSETIGTQTTDFSRYLSVDSTQKGADGKRLEFKDVLGVWGRTQPGAPVQYLQQAAVGLAPFANLSVPNRDKFLKQIDDKKIYKVDYSKTRSESINNRAVWVYPVEVNVAAYVGVLKDIAKATGFKDLDGLDPAAYEGSPPVVLELSVDKKSRFLKRLSFKDGQQSEDYSAYGITRPIDVPSDAISIDELQNRVQGIR